jgi:hypothetical protein
MPQLPRQTLKSMTKLLLFIDRAINQMPGFLDFVPYSA